MLKKTFHALVTLLTLAGASPAFGEGGPAVMYKQETEVDFEGVSIEGELIKPELNWIAEYPTSKDPCDPWKRALLSTSVDPDSLEFRNLFPNYFKCSYCATKPFHSMEELGACMADPEIDRRIGLEIAIQVNSGSGTGGGDDAFPLPRDVREIVRTAAAEAQRSLQCPETELDIETLKGIYEKSKGIEETDRSELQGFPLRPDSAEFEEHLPFFCGKNLASDSWFPRVQSYCTGERCWDQQNSTVPKNQVQFVPPPGKNGNRWMAAENSMRNQDNRVSAPAYGDQRLIRLQEGVYLVTYHWARPEDCRRPSFSGCMPGGEPFTYGLIFAPTEKSLLEGACEREQWLKKQNVLNPGEIALALQEISHLVSKAEATPRLRAIADEVSEQMAIKLKRAQEIKKELEQNGHLMPAPARARLESEIKSLEATPGPGNEYLALLDQMNDPSVMALKAGETACSVLESKYNRESGKSMDDLGSEAKITYPESGNSR